MNTNKVYTIKEIEKKFGFSGAYIRKSIKAGRLETTKVDLPNGGFKHTISEKQLKNWRDGVGGRSNREDGRNKFTLYATPEEMTKIEDLLKNAKVEAPVTRANPSKAS